MAAHKLTLLGHPARKQIQAYLRALPPADSKKIHQSNRRIAFADGVFAISGPTGVTFAASHYQVEIGTGPLPAAFSAMLGDFGAVESQDQTWDTHNCAEAHLWMTLAGRHIGTGAGQAQRHRHPHPRHLHVWIYELARKGGLKEDSPCLNCRQWVRREFRTLNGT